MNMFNFRLVYIFLFALCLSPLGLSALYEGQSMEDVVAELGTPNGKRTSPGREVWVYSGDITLEFLDGHLSRAKGTFMERAPDMPAPEAVPDSEPEAEAASLQTVEKKPPAETKAGELDKEIEQFSEGLPELPKELDGFMDDEDEEVPASTSILRNILLWAVPVFLGFIFLLIALKIVGVEATKSAVLFIAVADQAVMHGVQWLFLDLLGFPTALHADALASFVVMLILVNKMTYAKQLPVAIKVVIMSKVAGLVAWYFLLLFLLHNL
ncbi:hypothetical protein G0Q06_04500 [Puniceicoccales bacterium CK1056]|uniref:Uncharacterized protein n=1 Tax=Oceanipulchritudo coccoides TaxID=2706888 RepID=A0A6B2LZ42_9BACT|nr:hypothetical protein [Oceanipulchritudo coccoides]NDV61703.1 hypothetical protein [Oceanipulchritudo coccoides]